VTRATEQADPGTAARDCPESDSRPLGEGKKEEEAFKLIECVKLEERAGKRRHEDIPARWANPSEKAPPRDLQDKT